MIKAVIFDCFGVLTEDGWLAFLNKYSNSENIEEMRYANHQADRGQISYEEFLKTVCELSGAPEGEAHAMITTTHHPNEPLFEIIRKLKNTGYKLGIISNVGSELNNYLPDAYVQLFDTVTLSYQAGALKPEAAIYEAHLDRLSLIAAETVFFDDRASNVEGAKAVGMHSFMYENLKDITSNLHALDVTV